MPAARDWSVLRAAAAWRGWWPVFAGLLVLYVPTFHNLATSLWRRDEYAHGPIILALVLWLIWRGRSVLLAAGEPRPAPGIAALVLGLLVYVLGRSLDIALLEIGALVPILGGVAIAMCGWPAMRVLWFPVFFVVFMIPLPGVFVDALTGPLKHSVSGITTQLLYTAGYPVARDGVIILVGQYQLMVADACAGLYSMVSLSALGLLLVYLRARPSLLHNAIMVASILPIAFAANIARVLILILVTFHLGDEAGQSFIHGAAGIVLVVVAVAILLLMDGVLARAIRTRDEVPARARARAG